MQMATTLTCTKGNKDLDLFIKVFDYSGDIVSIIYYNPKNVNTQILTFCSYFIHTILYYSKAQLAFDDPWTYSVNEHNIVISINI